MFGIFEIFTLCNIQQRAVENASSLQDHSMSVTFADEGVTFDNPDIVSIIKWRRIHSIARLTNAWLFTTFSGSNFYAVPTSLITDTISPRPTHQHFGPRALFFTAELTKQDDRFDQKDLDTVDKMIQSIIVPAYQY